MSYETLRWTILVVAWGVWLLRTPGMIRDRPQRPLWWMLAVFAGGAIVIQPQFGAAINAIAAGAQFSNLVQGLWGVLSAAVTLEFASHLSGAPTRKRATRFAGALIAATGMTALFLITPPAGRFTPTGIPWSFAAYALLAAVYVIAASGAALGIMLRHLPGVQGRSLLLALLMVAVGNATEVPFMVIQTWSLLTPHVPQLLPVGYPLNAPRFILVPLGCVITMVEPLGTAVLQYYHRVRLYPLWRMLRSVTPQLALGTPVTRQRDIFTVNHTWERLHRRRIEIRDSIFYMHDAWADPQLLDDATRYANAAARPSLRSLLAVACVLEVTRRAASSGEPERHHELDETLLPQLFPDEATTRLEIRNLLRLHRAVRSRQVQVFADRAYRDAPGNSREDAA